MRVLSLVPLLASQLLSCQPMPPGDDGQGTAALHEQSGSRLRREYWVAADGTTVPTGGFYDTRLKQECYFLAYEGQRLCLPLGFKAPVDAAAYVSAELRVE